MAEADIWEKLCVIDTENESGSLYVGTVVNGVRVGEYLTITWRRPSARRDTLRPSTWPSKTAWSS